MDDGLVESDMDGPRNIKVGIDSLAAGSLGAVHVKLDGFRNRCVCYASGKIF